MKQSIEQMMGDFNPEKYADERREKILDLLKQKAKEKGRVEAPVVEEAEGAGPPDLVAALEESMRQVKKEAGEPNKSSRSPGKASPYRTSKRTSIPPMVSPRPTSWNITGGWPGSSCPICKTGP